MDKFVIFSTMIRSVITVLLCSALTSAHSRQPARPTIDQRGPAPDRAAKNPHWTISHGAIVRGDSSRKTVALVFTGDEFGDGLSAITSALTKHHVTGSFFFTGRFYRNPAFRAAIRRLYRLHNYLGPHSNAHLLYADWARRDST